MTTTMILYNEQSKKTCALTTLSLTLILVYFFFPFNKESIKGFFLKLCIMISLGITLYYQLLNNDTLLNINDLFSKNNASQFVCSAFFSVVMIIFIIYIGKTLFFS
jgi:hypothetical protein